MKKWAFLILLLSCGRYLATAGDLTAEPDSLPADETSLSPSKTGWQELSAEGSGQALAAPEDGFSNGLKLTDSIIAAVDADRAPKMVVPDKTKKRKKLIAALLAFPLPFGIIGFHRIYLGSKPYIPLIYIGTLGGCLGIIPFIDFIVICLEKDITKYCNNPNLIMWAK